MSWRVQPPAKGMNLTMEVRDGIINHTGAQPRSRWRDRWSGSVIASPISTMISMMPCAAVSSILDDIPQSSLALFGRTHRERIDNMVRDVVENSDGRERIYQSSDYKAELDHLRTFMFANVYKSSRVKREEDLNKVDVVLSSLYDYFLEHVEAFPEDLQLIAEMDGKDEAVKDYIAGMTDRFALSTYTELFVPKAWK